MRWVRAAGWGCVVGLAGSIVLATEAETPEPPPADETGYVEQVTVVGQQLERPLQDTPTSVTVLTGEQLERDGLRDLYEAVRRTPNVGERFGGKGFTIRGVSQNGFGTGGNGLLINVEVDGAAMPDEINTYFGPYSTWDLQQVEIHRGPQSTEHGRNALAGAIVIRTAEPTYEWESRLRTAWGERDAGQIAAVVNVPLVDDKLALRAAFDGQETDGWVINPTLDDEAFDERRFTHGHAKLRFDPIPDLSGLLTYSHTASDGGDLTVERLGFPTERINLSDLRTREGSEHSIYTLELDYTIGERWHLESVSNVYRHGYEFDEDVDRTDEIGNTRLLTRKDENFTTELRARYLGRRMTGVIGVYWADLFQETTTASELTSQFLGFPPGGVVFGDLFGDTETDNRALFGEVDLALGERWTLTAGARFDREEQDSFVDEEFLSVPRPIPNLPPERDEDVVAEWDAFLPKLAVTYHWTPTLSTSLSAQRGYRAGGLSIALISREIAEFDPEFSWNYELALRSEWNDGRLVLNANAFFVDWTDQQVAVRTELDTPLDTLTVNAGESRLQGLEIDLQASPDDATYLYLNGSLLSTRFVRFVDAGRDLGGNRFPFAPRTSATLGAVREFGPGFLIDGYVTVESSVFSEELNEVDNRIGTRSFASLKLGFEREHWSAFVVARNLLDSSYELLLSSETVRAAEPQSVSLELNLRF